MEVTHRDTISDTADGKVSEQIGGEKLAEVMIINGIELELDGKTHKFRDKGMVYTAKLAHNESYTSDLVREKLIGQLFNGKPILGIEMNCIEGQSGSKIGILVGIGLDGE